MNQQDIVQKRLENQILIGSPLPDPPAVVRWMGAVQAQEYYEAKWALGLRVEGFYDKDVQAAFDDGLLLRTHVMRPTWHFVAPEDIRWLLKLTAPRVNVTVGSYYRRFGLDDAVINASNEALARALQGEKHLMRSELETVLREHGIVGEDDDRLRLTFLVMRAELDGVICSGPRRGKQFTYALLEERVPPVPELEEEEALAALTRRYFTSHGPATAHDFSWWSGLTMAQVRQGLAMVDKGLERMVVDDKTYWFRENGLATAAPEQAWLLQSFDEYLIGYKDRSAALDPEIGYKIDREISMPVMYNGWVIGDWKRRFAKNQVYVTIRAFATFNAAQAEAVEAAVARYSDFLQMPVEVEYQT